MYNHYYCNGFTICMIRSPYKSLPDQPVMPTSYTIQLLLQLTILRSVIVGFVISYSPSLCDSSYPMTHFTSHTSTVNWVIFELLIDYVATISLWYIFNSVLHKLTALNENSLQKAHVVKNFFTKMITYILVEQYHLIICTIFSIIYNEVDQINNSYFQ